MKGLARSAGKLLKLSELRPVYIFMIFSTIHPDFSWSEKSGWIRMNRGEKWKYSVSLRFVTCQA